MGGATSPAARGGLRGGEALTALEDIYQGLPYEDFKKASRAFIEPLETGYRSFTYGELGFLAVKDFLAVCELEGKRDLTFYDLGSGSGKPVFQAALLEPCFSKLVGIELIPELHAFANQALERCAELGYGGQGIEFVCGDILREDWSDGDVIVINSTLFDVRMRAALEARLIEGIKPGAHILTLTHPLKSDAAFELLQSKHRRMSWGHAEMFMYRKKSKP